MNCHCQFVYEYMQYSTTVDLLTSLKLLAAYARSGIVVACLGILHSAGGYGLEICMHAMSPLSSL